MSERKTKKSEKIEDPGILQFILEGKQFYPDDAVKYPIAEQRAFYERYYAHFRRPRPPSVETKDIAFGSVSCRVYRKSGVDAPPLMVYLHGGGFILGGLESHDDICAEICDGAAIDVVAVDYRLAPEHPFPAALDDAWSVVCTLGKSYERMIIGGDSAGGNLAAALALRARDSGGPKLRGQVLIYPGLGGDITSGSYVSASHAPGYSTSEVEYYRAIYRGQGNKYAEPLRETDYSGLPPAFLVAAGLDPLHDDSLAYARRLSAAGVASVVRDEPLLVHAFIRARNMSAPARASFDAIIAACTSLAHHGTLPAIGPDSRFP
ncbi:MAG: alpha/beta hydrolase [Alphaproteobacteria bacterium]|nr:alpha/beta hydrolase [Alphaproteobacteria bacterium]